MCIIMMSIWSVAEAWVTSRNERGAINKRGKVKDKQIKRNQKGWRSNWIYASEWVEQNDNKILKLKRETLKAKKKKEKLRTSELSSLVWSERVKKGISDPIIELPITTV